MCTLHIKYNIKKKKHCYILFLSKALLRHENENHVMGQYVYMINSLYPEYSENFKNLPPPPQKGQKME